MWKKIRLGFMLSMRVQTLLALWDSVEVRTRFQQIVAADSILAPLAAEIRQLIADAKQILR